MQLLEGRLMRKIIAGTLFMVLAGTLAVGTPQQDRDDRHDNGKHKGEYKHVEDDGDRHDNGQHKGWYKHGDRDDYRDSGDDHDASGPATHIHTVATCT
jgi:hypothetical protein